jgi:predicted dehydrogenase
MIVVHSSNISLRAAAAPFFRPGLRAAAGDRVFHASFGASGMAWADLTTIARHPAVEIAAVADVDLSRTGEFRQKFPQARVYQDWRELLDRGRTWFRERIHARSMHGPIAMAALQRGLHVYGQKPLTHDLYETRRLTEVAREKKRVTQMGIQIHSNREYRMAVRLVQDGVIGKVKEVHTWSEKKWGDTEPMPTRVDPVPEGLDWDAWIGVSAERPFIGEGWYHPGNWRRRLDFGTGTFGDMGCHIYDPVLAGTYRADLGAAPNAHSGHDVIHYLCPDRTPLLIRCA